MDNLPTRRTEGRGLGLVIVRRIVEAPGGDITLPRGPGRAHRFTPRLPVDKA